MSKNLGPEQTIV
ncbi:hypothetical protein CGLO_17719 [Colletotrichum gloeosporioides Cg-14]|uniref:Uncharacterized protein n=1 Tax=Colletotrichum gloeosporioides (strain Cg-14) TaxID=1237896 RepID=T0L5Q7_COLGC|nr:hypothetical protein CGLO_17719 [Colletotrichum gloeosporioides Cg-14]